MHRERGKMGDAAVSAGVVELGKKLSAQECEGTPNGTALVGLAYSFVRRWREAGELFV